MNWRQVWTAAAAGLAIAAAIENMKSLHIEVMELCPALAHGIRARSFTVISTQYHRIGVILVDEADAALAQRCEQPGQAVEKCLD